MASINIKLLFDTQAEEAAIFYTGLFANGKIDLVTRYPKEREECVACGINPAEAGSVMNVDFEIEGTFFTAINGKRGPEYSYSSSLSLLVHCKNEGEMTKLYRKLCENREIVSPLAKDVWDGKHEWVQDKFGVYWCLMITKIYQQKITPLLLFSEEQNGRINDASHFYTHIFKKSSVSNQVRKLVVRNETFFSLENQDFVGGDIQSAPPFTEAISFIVLCTDQEEVDYYWNELTKQGDGYYREASAWLVDRYGIWWQIITTNLTNMMRETEHLQHSIRELEENNLINVEKIKGKRKP